jgi:hypothetical protein
MRIRIRDGKIGSGIRDKHHGSATLLDSIHQYHFVERKMRVGKRTKLESEKTRVYAQKRPLKNAVQEFDIRRVKVIII